MPMPIASSAAVVVSRVPANSPDVATSLIAPLTPDLPALPDSPNSPSEAPRSLSCAASLFPFSSASPASVIDLPRKLLIQRGVEQRHDNLAAESLGACPP